MASRGNEMCCEHNAVVVYQDGRSSVHGIEGEILTSYAVG